MTQNPKAKGGQYERDFCRQLSLWWTKGKDEDVFWRTASSGGKATVNKNLPTQLGDVTYIKPEGQILIDNFVFELKHYNYKGLDWLPILEEKGNIYGWWVKLCEEAKPFNKTPFLIIKVSHRGVYGILPHCYFTKSASKMPFILGLNIFDFAFGIDSGRFSVFNLDKFLGVFADNPEKIIL